MNAPVSTIIPCYRCRGTIARAVESVAKQTLLPAEVILVDDGSADGTLEVLYTLQRKYGKEWLKIIALECNGGPSVARNTGWEASSSQYVAFLDADDAWHPEKIATQYKWMKIHPNVALCGHSHMLLDLNASAPSVPLKRPLASWPITRDALLLSNPFVTPSVMIKCDVPYRFDPSKRYCEDYFLWLQLGLDGLIIATLDAPLVFVFKRWGTSGASSDLWRMRSGDINNYWQLWRARKLALHKMNALVVYSIIKFIFLLLVGTTRYEVIKHRIEQAWSRL